MLCCLGLVAGFAAGAALGESWAFLAPIAGFGLGLIGDFTADQTWATWHRQERWAMDMKERELHHEESKEV